MHNVVEANYSAIVPGERRRRLLSAAMAVIAENELENVTMDRIANIAGVARVTLYREFGNRAAMIEAVIAYRLVLFDEHFFANAGDDSDLASLIQRYLIASVRASRTNPVTRRWASGGMRFIYSGSLIHQVSSATWTPVLDRLRKRRGEANRMKAEDLALWLTILQYSLGRMVVETGCDDEFVSPAMGSQLEDQYNPDTCG